ncbi:MAG: hypothetical protein ACRD51_17945 [Candidatus Acidiferrum sp.]
MRTSAGIFAVAILFLIANHSQGTAAETKLEDARLGPGAEQHWIKVVRDVIQHEVDAEAHDNSLWCYRKLKENNGEEHVFEACQAKGAEIDRLMSVNGKALDEREQQAEDERIEHLLRDPDTLEKKAQERREDAKRAAKMLRLIPNAFLFQKESIDGDVVRLRFTPNPDFHPLGHEANVFHHMDGTLTLNLKQKRLAEINGYLSSKVEFGYGLLGHLDQGGTFLVKQQEVGPGFWEIATLDVNMHGKALFFKTIGVQQKEIDNKFQRLPATLTIEQAAAMTKNRTTKTAERK